MFFSIAEKESLNFWHRSFTFNSNKSPTWCNNFSVYYPEVCLQLNMFRAFSRPSSRAQWLQWQPLVLPSYRSDSRPVFVIGAVRPAGPTTNTAFLKLGWNYNRGIENNPSSFRMLRRPQRSTHNPMSDTTALFSDNHKFNFQPEVLLFRRHLSIVRYNFLLHHYNSLNL
jgi:hypothetical protein